MQRWLDTTGKLSYHFSLSFGSSDDKKKTMDLGKELFGEEVITGFRDIRVARNMDPISHLYTHAGWLHQVTGCNADEAQYCSDRRSREKAVKAVPFPEISTVDNPPLLVNNHLGGSVLPLLCSYLFY
jgi:hypothetical protein